MSGLIRYHKSEVNDNDGLKDVQRPTTFHSLHRLPIEIRLRIFEFAICAAAPSPAGRLAKINRDKGCRCSWFETSYGPQQLRWRTNHLLRFDRVHDVRRALRSLTRTSSPKVLSEGGMWLCGVHSTYDDRTYLRDLRMEHLELPFLALDKQLAVEAMDVFYGINHFWLTSREALDLSDRPEVVSRLRELTIFERNPRECIFTNMDPCDLCDGECQVETRQLMLLHLLSGNRLRRVTLQLQAFYGRRVRLASQKRQQGIGYFVAATGFEHFTTWKCTDIGLYEIDSVIESHADGGDGRRFVFESQSQVSNRLRKLRLEYQELRGAWATALAVPSTELEWFKAEHELMVYHWQCRHLWMFKKFPHRCERWSQAIDMFLRWVRWNIEQFHQGHLSPMVRRFVQDYLPLRWTDESIQPPYSIMPGSDYRLLHYWTEEFSKGIAGNIWDNPTF